MVLERNERKKFFMLVRKKITVVITTRLESFNENIIYQFMTASFFLPCPFFPLTHTFLLGMSQNQFSLPHFFTFFGLFDMKK